MNVYVDPKTGKPMMRLPAGTLDRKPPHGKACNGCGLCCMATLCGLGKHVYGQELGPCPALRQVDATHYACGLAQLGPPLMQDLTRTLIGAGSGCDARFNGEPVDHAFNRWLADVWDSMVAARVKAAKQLWGMK